MNLAPLPIQKFFSNIGLPLVGGKLFTYAAGTNTKIATYTDSSGVTQNTNPIILNFRGECRVWIDPALAYKFILSGPLDTDPPTNPIWTVDNITAGPAPRDNAAVDTGSVNNIQLAIPLISSPGAFTRIVFKALNTNTGPVTISINGGTAHNLTWQNLGLMGGAEIQAGGLYEVIFDGARWQLQGPTLSPPELRTPQEIAAGLVPVNYSYPFGNALRHGFDPTGVSNNAPKWTTALLAAYDGVPLYFPAGVYLFGSPITTAKPHRTTLIGDRNPSYAFDKGTIFRFFGHSGVGLTVGAEDGNPDSTGFTRDFYASDITFRPNSSFTQPSDGLKIVNTALAVLERCKFRGFPGKQVWLRGGNVIVRVNDCDIQGLTGGSNCVGVYMDDYQFGNFVTHVERNHIFGCNYAGRFSEGRYLNWTRNTIENIVTDIYLFETSGYISHAWFNKNYHELTYGYAFRGAPFAGLILKLVVNNNEFWGTGDALLTNPGFGDFDKNRVIEHDIRDNWIATADRNAVAGLGLPAVYPDTHLFAIGTTIAIGEPVNYEYEDLLARAMRGTDLLGTAGDFANITATPEPFGWTDATGAGTWALTQSELLGGPSCNVPSAGDSDMATKTIAVTPIARVRYFVIGFTYKGWGALYVDTGSGYTLLFDAGSNVANYTTVVTKFTIPVSAASFTMKISRNALNPIWVGEMRIFETGSADYNNPGPGSLGSAMVNAVRRNMLKGAR